MSERMSLEESGLPVGMVASDQVSLGCGLAGGCSSRARVLKMLYEAAQGERRPRAVGA